MSKRVLVCLIFAGLFVFSACGQRGDDRVAFSYRPQAGESQAYQLEYSSASFLNGELQMTATFAMNYTAAIEEVTAEGVARITCCFDSTEARLEQPDGTVSSYPISAFSLDLIQFPDGTQTIVGAEEIYTEMGLRPLTPVWPDEGIALGESWDEVTILTLSGLPELHLIITHTLEEKDSEGRLHLSENVALSGSGDLPFEGAVFTGSGAGEILLDTEQGRLLESRYTFVLDGESRNGEAIRQEITLFVRAVS